MYSFQKNGETSPGSRVRRVGAAGLWAGLLLRYGMRMYVSWKKGSIGWGWWQG